jgi:hypothetical protein
MAFSCGRRFRLSKTRADLPGHLNLAGAVGFEPTPSRLTAERPAVGPHPISTATSNLVRPERFELPTLWFVAKCSDPLSYGRILATAKYWYRRRDSNPLFARFEDVPPCPKATPAFLNLVRMVGFEPTTSAFAGLRSKSAELHAHTYFKTWCPLRDSNSRPLPSEGSALLHLS